jgi:hypothetical protein
VLWGPDNIVCMRPFSKIDMVKGSTLVVLEGELEEEKTVWATSNNTLIIADDPATARYIARSYGLDEMKIKNIHKVRFVSGNDWSFTPDMLNGNSGYDLFIFNPETLKSRFDVVKELSFE